MCPSTTNNQMSAMFSRLPGSMGHTRWSCLPRSLWGQRRAEDSSLSFWWSRTRLKWLSSSSSSNLFFLANLVLMSSQDVRYRKGSGQNSCSLDIFFNLFSAAGWEVYKAPLKLVRRVLSCPLPVPLAGHFLYPFYFNKFYTKLWVTETVFGPRVKSSHLETVNSVTLFTISYHELLSTRSHMQLVSLLLVSLSLKLIYFCLPGQFSE